MAEYYPLLAKAVGSLPNSTPETRRVIYERARKALIGQLRTLHPPVPDEDIERESIELDRAVQRLEAELAVVPTPTAPPPPEPQSPPVEPGVEMAPPPQRPKPPSMFPASAGMPPTSGSLGPPAKRPPIPALRPKMPAPKNPDTRSPELKSPEFKTPRVEPPTSLPPKGPRTPDGGATEPVVLSDLVRSDPIDPKRPRMPGSGDGKTRPDVQRPIAPQPPAASGPKRRMWIIPAGVGIIVLIVGIAAWKLRDRPETVVRTKPIAQTQPADSGKTAERIGDKPASSTGTEQSGQTQTATDNTASQQAAPTPSNPEVPVAHRAALLMEAPDEPNKVKTFLGTVVWKLNNVSASPSDAVGVAVEADIDLPDDKTKATIIFEKNTDSSLPTSHTIKIRFNVQSGSTTGDVKQISVPQMRREDSPSGEALAGVTVSIVQNSFLVGLSPGNAETANIELLGQLQWIDIPLLLTSGKIAKLTFEKGDSGERDVNAAIAAWQKQ